VVSGAPIQPLAMHAWGMFPSVALLNMVGKRVSQASE
jgi:hypothetical protein